MFVILIYDVASKRVSKAQKLAKKYLSPVQKSVFEGFITESKTEKLKGEFLSLIDTETDLVIIYKFGSLRFAEKQELGTTKALSFDFIV